MMNYLSKRKFREMNSDEDQRQMYRRIYEMLLRQGTIRNNHSIPLCQIFQNRSHNVRIKDTQCEYA